MTPTFRLHIKYIKLYCLLAPEIGEKSTCRWHINQILYNIYVHMSNYALPNTQINTDIHNTTQQQSADWLNDNETR